MQRPLKFQEVKTNNANHHKQQNNAKDCPLHVLLYVLVSSLCDFSPSTGTSSLYSLIGSSRPCVVVYVSIKQEWCGFDKRVVSNGGGWAMGKIIAEASTNTKQMPCWGRVCYVFAMELTRISSLLTADTICTGRWEKQWERDMPVSSCW
jgi:hypothetical protein